jgi:hypothetical protein
LSRLEEPEQGILLPQILLDLNQGEILKRYWLHVLFQQSKNSLPTLLSQSEAHDNFEELCFPLYCWLDKKVVDGIKCASMQILYFRGGKE